MHFKKQEIRNKMLSTINYLIFFFIKRNYNLCISSYISIYKYLFNKKKIRETKNEEIIDAYKAIFG
jgi:hypothetical protein